MYSILHDIYTIFFVGGVTFRYFCHQIYITRKFKMISKLSSVEIKSLFFLVFLYAIIAVVYDLLLDFPLHFIETFNIVVDLRTVFTNPKNVVKSRKPNLIFFKNYMYLGGFGVADFEFDFFQNGGSNKTDLK